MAKAQLIETYAFRRDVSVASSLAYATGSPEAAALAAIEDELVNARQDVLARRYQDAINHYRNAEALIWQQLDANAPGRAVVDFTPPRALSIYPVLAELSLEWVHVLPVPTPRPGPLPVAGLDSRLVKQAQLVDQSGIKAAALVTPEAASALSLLDYGVALKVAGNAAAADSVRARAIKLSPDTVALWDKGQTGVAGVASAQATMAAAASVPTPTTLTATRSLNVAIDGTVKTLSWQIGNAPVADALALIYEPRTKSTYRVATDRLIHPIDAADSALSLTHAYFYEIPLGLAECYHALGDWPNAEANYLQAAGYQYLNPTTEAPFVWVRLGTLYVDWGVQLYKSEQYADALAVFTKVLSPTQTVPSSPLWNTAGLAPAVLLATPLVAQLSNQNALAAQPAIAIVLLSAWEQIVKLKAGLDFWGLPAQTVPIWTYEYLRSVSVQFSQLAVSAERDVINFWSKAQDADLTRLQLGQAVGQASAELTATARQRDAAQAEVTVYNTARDLANLRAGDAATDASAYAAMSADQIVHMALSSQLAGGDDGDSSQLDALADQMMLGNYSIDGSRATLSAAEGLTAQRLNRQYEVGRLQRQATEMQKASQQAQAELNAAQARLGAANAAVTAAALRATNAKQLADAFDAQLFTPEVWWRLGDTMNGIYRRYLTMAIKTARLMQQAYNFESDSDLHVIRADYTDVEVAGLLAADALLADIESFDYDLVINTKDKVQPVKLTLSLAQRYGYAFETQLRGTGAMDFETVIDDFDLAFPGTYGGRVEAVEVAVEGLVPVTGVRGTLTNNGVSSYRVPGGVAVKYRLQPRETLVLSDYAKREDEPMVPTDARVRGTFTGAGVASSWRLELPKGVNDLDYGALTDVKLTLYYRTRFDPVLRDQVLTQLAAQPSINAGQRAVPLRWLYPDAYFRLQDTGTTTVTLRPADLPRSQGNPKLTSIGVVVATDGSVPASGLTLTLATPGHPAPVAATTAAGGIISGTAGAWLPLGTGNLLGDYTIALPAGSNPTLDRAALSNVALVLGYTFTPRS